MEIIITAQEIRLADMKVGDEVFMQTVRKIQGFLANWEDTDSLSYNAIENVTWHTTEQTLRIQGKEFTPVNLFTAETRHEYTGSTYPLVKRYIYDILDTLRLETP